MKVRTLILLALCAAVPAAACAQKKGKKDKKNAEVVAAPAEEAPIVTEDCIMYTSLFHESAKNKQYADALDNWLLVYNTCPSYSKNVYADGEKIVEWKLSTLTAGTAEYDEWRNKLMKLYDDRIKYFGDDTKYPTSFILGQKALNYCEYFPEADKTPAMEWLRASIEGQQGNSNPLVVLKLAELSLAAYRADRQNYVNQYLADYQLCSDAFQSTANVARIAYNEVADQIEAATDEAVKNKLEAQLKKEDKKVVAAVANKNNLDNQFAQSGAADCDLLNQLFAPIVEANTTNMEVLQKVLKLYRRLNCVESDVYFAASEASHKLNPTAESAAGCAAMSLKKAEYKDAIAYYEQATELSDDVEDKAKYQYAIAYLQLNVFKNYSTAVNYAKRALKFDAKYGACYILIGKAYAYTQPYTKEKYGPKAPILNKTIYWLAVDQFEKAKQVDPSCAAEANREINTYSKYFPTKENMFDLPGEFKDKKTFTISEGWINETTTIRR